MNDEKDREWDPSKVGDHLMIVDPVRLMFYGDIYDAESIELQPGEIVMSLGQAVYGDMFYLTVFGVGGLPEDLTFYIHESVKLC